MSDIFSKRKRSQIMASVRNKNTAPEIKVKNALRRMGLRFVRVRKPLPGSPDVILSKYHTVIFVHGCFWHGHRNCSRAIQAKSNTIFWRRKIAMNRKRDRMAVKELIGDGWKVIIIWECQLRNQSVTARTFNALEKAILGEALKNI